MWLLPAATLPATAAVALWTLAGTALMLLVLFLVRRLAALGEGHVAAEEPLGGGASAGAPPREPGPENGDGDGPDRVA